MACSSSVIPRHAVELLFAEDFVSRIMRRHTGMEFKSWRAAPYRAFIFNAFSEDIAEAVDFIDMMLEWEADETFSRLIDEHRVDRDTFISYALHLEELYFKQGFDADNFLNFCVRITSLAAYFAQYGMPLELDLSLFFIIKVMTKYDLFEGGWDTLNAVARKYMEKKEDYYNILTPDASDDEPLMNIFLDDSEEEDEAEGNSENGDSSFAINQEEKPKEESDHEKMDSSGLKSKVPDNSKADPSGCVLNKDRNFAADDEKKPKNEADRQKMDLPDISENIVDGYVFKEENGTLDNDEKKPNEELDRLKKSSSGTKLELPASSENEEAEGHISNIENEFAIPQEDKPQDKQDRKKIDVLGLKSDLPVSSAASEGKLKTGIL